MGLLSGKHNGDPWREAATAPAFHPLFRHVTPGRMPVGCLVLCLLFLWAAQPVGSNHGPSRCMQFNNTKTVHHPEVADHPSDLADIVIATEADFGEHNYIRDGVLGGFDIELTKAVCAQIGKTCSIVTVPWQSIWPSEYARFGYPENDVLYPGEGHHDRWFHCSVGTYNTVHRQQSIAFTHPYTSMNHDTIGFIVPDGAASRFPANAVGQTVGLLEGWAATSYFEMYRTVYSPQKVLQYGLQTSLWGALTAGTVDAGDIAPPPPPCACECKCLDTIGARERRCALSLPLNGAGA